MRVVNRDKFLELPSGTVYRKLAENDDALYVKGDTINNGEKNIDWFYVSFNEVESEGSDEYYDRIDSMEQSGAEYPLEIGLSRDGLYEKGDMFYVLDGQDVMNIIDILSDTLD